MGRQSMIAECGVSSDFPRHMKRFFFIEIIFPCVQLVTVKDYAACAFVGSFIYFISVTQNGFLLY